MIKTIVISGELEEANRLALIISLAENNYNYNLFDATLSHAEEIIKSTIPLLCERRATIVKNVSRETDLKKLLAYFVYKIPLIVTCDFEVKNYEIDFLLITIKNIV